MSSALSTPQGFLILPFEPYRDVATTELEDRIRAIKAEMGETLLILGHHYQQDEVIQFADKSDRSHVVL